MTLQPILCTDGELTDEIRSRLKQSFLKFHQDALRNAQQKDVEFPLENITTALETEFDCNCGDFWIVFEKKFLTYSETNDCIAVYHFCASSDVAKVLLLKRLAKVSQKKRFIAAVRKCDKAEIECLKSFGCKIIRNPLPNFSTAHYYGVEMPATLAMELTLLPSDLLASIFKQ